MSTRGRLFQWTSTIPSVAACLHVDACFSNVSECSSMSTRGRLFQWAWNKSPHVDMSLHSSTLLKQASTCRHAATLGIVLAHWNKRPRVDMLLHSDTLLKQASTCRHAATLGIVVAACLHVDACFSNVLECSGMSTCGRLFQWASTIPSVAECLHVDACFSNVSECSSMSTRGLLFQWASTIKMQLSVLV
jgi:hypothetical protein